MDLYAELQELTKNLNIAIADLRESGIKLAECEKNYKIMLRKWCLYLKSTGMAVGMIDKTCYGIEEVAELRFERDVAEAVYKTNQESINAIKLQMRLIEEQIKREWGNA